MNLKILAYLYYLISKVINYIFKLYYIIILTFIPF